jgi:O-antigen/teichoic acid export membrane protein
VLSRYFKNVALLVVVQLLLAVKGLVLIPVLTKTFGAVDYGIWTQVSMVAGLLAPLLVMGTDSAVIRFLPSAGRAEKRQGLSTILLYGALASLAVAVLLWLASVPLASAFFAGPENAPFVTVCGFVVFTQVIFNTLRDWYRVEDQAAMWGAMNALQAVLWAGVAAAAAVTGTGIFALVLATTLLDGLLCLAFAAQIARRHGLARPRGDLLRRYLRFGAAVMPVGYAAWVLGMSNRLFLVHYGGLGDVGVYSVVYALGYTFINIFFNPIWLMYPARASELYDGHDLEGLRRLFRYSAKAALGILIPVMLGFAVLAEPIMRVVTAEEFVRGAHLVPVVTLGYVLLMLGSYWSVSLSLVRRPGLHTVNMAVAAGASVLLNALLVPRWGITGAAYATAISFALLMALSVWSGSRHIRLGFDWTFLVKSVVAAGVMAMVVAVARPGDGLPGLVLDVAVGVAAYVTVLVLLRAVSSDEWRAALRLVGLEWLVGYRLVRLVTGIAAP